MSCVAAWVMAAAVVAAQDDPAAGDISPQTRAAMERFVGRWAVEGNHGPAAFKGDYTIAWAPGGHCLVQHIEGTLGGKPVALSGVMGCHALTQELIDFGFISLGNSHRTVYWNVQDAEHWTGRSVGVGIEGQAVESPCKLEWHGPDECNSTFAASGAVPEGAYHLQRVSDATRPAAVYEQLKFLDALVGDWQVLYEQDGRKVVGSFRAAWAPGKYGLVWTTDAKLAADGTPLFHGSGITIWDPVEKKAREYCSLSDGTVATASLEAKEGKLYLARTGTLADGTNFTTQTTGSYADDQWTWESSSWTTAEGKTLQTISRPVFKRVRCPD